MSPEARGGDTKSPGLELQTVVSSRVGAATSAAPLALTSKYSSARFRAFTRQPNRGKCFPVSPLHPRVPPRAFTHRLQQHSSPLIISLSPWFCHVGSGIPQIECVQRWDMTVLYSACSALYQLGPSPYPLLAPPLTPSQTLPLLYPSSSPYTILAPPFTLS